MRRRFSSFCTTSEATLDSRSSSRTKIAELRAAFVGVERLIEAGGVWYGALHVPHPVDVPSEPFGDLFVCGLALELNRELVVGAGHLPHLLARVHGHPYGPALVGDGPLDGLPDPPGGVGGEAEAPLRVELVRRPHEPYVALLDEVPEGQALAPVLLGDRDDEPEVPLDELAPRRLVAFPRPTAEIYLLLVRKEPSAADLPEVPRKRARGLPITQPVCRLSCYLDSSSLGSFPALVYKTAQGAESLPPAIPGAFPFAPRALPRASPHTPSAPRRDRKRGSIGPR